MFVASFRVPLRTSLGAKGNRLKNNCEHHANRPRCDSTTIQRHKYDFGWLTAHITKNLRPTLGGPALFAQLSILPRETAAAEPRDWRIYGPTNLLISINTD